MSDWTPFKRNGKLRVIVYTDPWWKRLYGRLRGWPLWHEMGYMTDDDAMPGKPMDEIPEPADEEPGWPASEYFQPDPGPYTLQSYTQFFRDWRGARYHW